LPAIIPALVTLPGLVRYLQLSKRRRGGTAWPIQLTCREEFVDSSTTKDIERAR